MPTSQIPDGVAVLNGAAIMQLLEEILAQLRHANSNDRSGAVSSVKITLQRGTVDIACHAYVGSDIAEAENEAVASYRRVLADLNAQGAEAFAAEVARRVKA